MSDIDPGAQVARAAALRAEGRHEHAQSLLRAALAAHPDHAGAHYQLACLLDAEGQESDAVPYYERALALGLEDDDLRGALLGLGSTYRTLGQYTEAERMLRRGAEAYPGDASFPVFRAMALYNLGRHEEAMRVLLQVIATTSGDVHVQHYARAIRLYASDLERVWE